MEYPVVDNDTSVFSYNPLNRIGYYVASDPFEKAMSRNLYFAFRRSLRDAESYESIVSSIPIKDERRTFLCELSDRKRLESEKLYFYYRIGGNGIFKDFKKRSIISHPHYEIPVDDSLISSVEDTYSFAYKKELRNFELYNELAKHNTAPLTKILFDYLAQLQSGHLGFIEKKIFRCRASSTTVREF